MLIALHITISVNNNILNDKTLCFQVKDICNELDVRSLCHKILQNVSTLLHADRGSLFLVQGERMEKSPIPAPKKPTPTLPRKSSINKHNHIRPIGCISIEEHPTRPASETGEYRKSLMESL